MKELNLVPLVLRLSWCFATRMVHCKIPVSKLNKIHITYAKVRSSLWIFYVRVVAWVTVEDRMYKFLILRKSWSYWIWGILGVGVFCGFGNICSFWDSERTNQSLAIQQWNYFMMSITIFLFYLLIYLIYLSSRIKCYDLNNIGLIIL